MTKEIGDSKILDVWAANGAAIAPDAGKTNDGWQSGERPAYQYMNYLQNLFMQKINHVMQYGVPLWDADNDYLIGSVVNSGGKLYVAVLDNSASEPPSADWTTTAVKDNFTAIAAPTVTNDDTEGYSPGSRWYYNGDIWLCVDASTGAAVWVDTGLQITDLGSLAFLDNINNSNWVGADLDIEHGGTGASTAPAARAALNVYSKTEADALVVGSSKAWVNFNGTGVVAIRDSYNVSSITDNNTGDYTVNLTTAMANVNYAPVCSAYGSAGNDTNNNIMISYNSLALGSVGVTTGNTGGTQGDFEGVFVAIFGDQ